MEDTFLLQCIIIKKQEKQATCSLLPSEMIANLERTPITVQQNKDLKH